jgi:serine/threonine protein kinase
MSYTFTNATAEYMVGPTIGQGRFAHVVYAVHKTSRRKVAIKVVEQVSLRKFSPWLLQSIMLEKQILQESNNSSNKEQQNNTETPSWLVSLWAAFYDTQHLYLVMELCTGGDLEDLIRQHIGVLQAAGNDGNGDSDESSEAQKILAAAAVEREQWLQHSIPFYASQLLQAVQFLHNRDKRILHCDLKPSNILLDADSGRLKLADFGSAVEMNMSHTASSPEPETSSSTNHPTTPGAHGAATPRGTTEYSCPELIRATPPAELNEGVDYWSVGCIVYAMTHAGKSPFDCESEVLTVQAITQYCSDGEFLTTRVERANDGTEPQGIQMWHRIWRGLLRKDPTDRIQFWDEGDEIQRLLLERMHPLASIDKQHVVLPQPRWKEEVDSATLKDGNAGWIAFAQL